MAPTSAARCRRARRWLARLRQPDRGGRAARGRDRPRPRLGRRHRRHPLGPARRPAGTAYGLDMTDEMLALARRNARGGRRHERPLPQGRDRGRSLCPQTRSTSSSRTASSTSPWTSRRCSPRSRACSSPAGGSASATSSRRTADARAAGRARQLRRLHRGRAVERASTRRAWRRPDSRRSSSPSPMRPRTACTARSSRRNWLGNRSKRTSRSCAPAAASRESLVAPRAARAARGSTPSSRAARARRGRPRAAPRW